VEMMVDIDQGLNSRLSVGKKTRDDIQYLLKTSLIMFTHFSKDE
jgi:hypothetical protein